MRQFAEFTKTINLTLLVGLLGLMEGAGANSPQTVAVTSDKPTLAGTGVGKEQPKVVLLTVNGHEITARDYAEHLQMNAAHIGAAISSPEARTRIVKQLVSSYLLKEKLNQDGVINDKQSQAEQSAALQKFAAEHFPLPKTVEESVAYSYYQAHQDEFGIPEMVRVSQIQFLAPEDSSEKIRAEAKAKADAAFKRLQAGEPFPKLAAELTENPLGKVPEGDLGYLAIGSNPWLKKSLEGLGVGKHTDVLESPVGYEILMVTDIRPAVISPYPNSREKVMQRVKVAEQQRLRDEYVSSLGKAAKIEIKEADLKKLFPNGLYP